MFFGPEPNKNETSGPELTKTKLLGPETAKTEILDPDRQKRNFWIRKDLQLPSGVVSIVTDLFKGS
jgi:hypothetical protein